MPDFINSFGHIQSTPRDSRVGSTSKTVHIIWTMDSSWCTQESFSRKLDWWANNDLEFSRCSNKELKISLSTIFLQISSRETGL